ncbi:auxin response factor 22-like [Vicia villosa]|uniref:auxin response factor 22-like n=1 Tax=Vicia villosa TaxID=3911 RepID=UPI00273CB1F9|nr:auxin response factor 22-like [Vicia villosa]
MVKNDDTSKGCSIFNGTISATSHPSTCPWRMLQIPISGRNSPEIPSLFPNSIPKYTISLKVIYNTHTLADPLILCTVSAVDLLADPETQQVYAKLLLTSVIDGSVVPLEASNEEDVDQIVSYAKTLTRSDVKSRSVLYVPAACAKSIFPALPRFDSRNQSPFQDLFLTEVCGVVWKFRYVFRGYTLRHLFTTGWSGFVREKKLVRGDTIVFIKNSAGNISVGIRRKMNLPSTVKITEKEVNEAAELAEKNAAFEVVYYPTVGGFDFVVGAKIVEDAMKVNWRRWMRVTHMVKNDDTTNGCSIFHGTISNLSTPVTRPWRMLQIEWDEPHVSENLEQLCPWQVEVISNSLTPDIQFPLTKKVKSCSRFCVIK